MRILKLTPATQANILETLLQRSPNSYGEFEERVADIIEEVRRNRDAAIFAYTKKFDGAEIGKENLLVTEDEIKEAYEQVDPKLLAVMRKALVNIKDYHEKQRQSSWFDSKESGILLGQKITPLKTVGVYVPGGKAVYPSSVLMNVVPAKV
ncbi:MAG: histidinol dehydrogenase, partial [Clostridiales bacterium]|nr:histidinol dehydrogenase [Clostridiales bacterium]